MQPLRPVRPGGAPPGRPRRRRVGGGGHDLARAEGAQRVGALGPGHRGDGRAAQHRELHTEAADAAGGAGHEDLGAEQRRAFRARLYADGSSYDPHVWTRAAAWAAAFAALMAPGSPLHPVAEHTARQLVLDAEAGAL